MIPEWWWKKVREKWECEEDIKRKSNRSERR